MADSNAARYKRWLAFKRDGNGCFYCRKTIRFKEGTSDHFHPRSKGGSNKACNIVFCCFRCNHLKGDLLPLDFIMKRLRQECSQEGVRRRRELIDAGWRWHAGFEKWVMPGKGTLHDFKWAHWWHRKHHGKVVAP